MKENNIMSYEMYEDFKGDDGQNHQDRTSGKNSEQ